MNIRALRTPALLAGATSLALVAACTPSGGGGGEDAADGSAAITWAVGGALAKPGGIFSQLVDQWNEENPDINVTLEALPDSADEQREQLALELQAGGSGFDVVSMDVIWTGEFSENGWIESFEDQREELEAVTLQGPMESAQWNGELWAAPYNSNPAFLYYRTDLVETPPTTWDELCQVATEVGQANDMGGYIGQGAQYEGLVVNWLEHYWSAGGELLSEDQSAVLFDEPTATAATQWFADGQTNGCFAPGFNTAQEEEARNEFQEGNVVFMRNWPYVWTVIEEDASSPANGNTGIAPLPTVGGEGTISALGGANNGVSAFSEHKEEAKQFAMWLATDEEAQKRMAVEATQPATLASIYEDPELADNPVLSLIGDILPDAKPRPPAPQWNELSVEMQRSIYPAYNGEADPAAASQAIASYLNEQFGQ